MKAILGKQERAAIGGDAVSVEFFGKGIKGADAAVLHLEQREPHGAEV